VVKRREPGYLVAVNYAQDLIGKFEKRRATVGVIGLGYVGLPLAEVIAEAGFAAIGFDTDQSKVESLLAGRSYIRHVDSERLRTLVRGEPGTPGGFHPTADYSLLASCDGVLICVPTPLTEGRDPDLSYVSSTADTIAEHVRPGQVVVLESTTYPGTTEEVVKPKLERGGLVAGRDFFLAFSPEREDPNNRDFSTRTIPKLVGGVTPECGRVATALYAAVIDKVIPVSDAKVAEAAKLLENIYRSVNIALVNELKVLFQKMDIDIWEVVEAASSKPFGFTAFYPGPGLGGHCIPIDPFYLSWRARQYEMETRFIELAGEVNHSMPSYVVDRLAEALNDRGKSLKGARLLILGVAYKRDIDDDRESPAFKVMDLLQRKQAVLSYHDPYVPVLRRSRRYDFGLQSVRLDAASVGAADAVVIVTDHSGVDYEMVVREASLVVDTRNATRHVTAARDNVVLA
jgi:UDP-N-acetyl-D-glucosamine dehydrogenase